MITLACEQKSFKVFPRLMHHFSSYLQYLFWSRIITIIFSSYLTHANYFHKLLKKLSKGTFFNLIQHIIYHKLFSFNMQQKNDDLIDCPKCNSKLFKEVWGIHKIMCHQSKSIMKKQKEKSSSFLKTFYSSIDRQEKSEEALIPCIECGENVPFELYALHEQECIGQQLVQCKNCNIKFPVFLIEQHNGVCEGKENNFEFKQENEQHNEQQAQQAQANEQLLALIQNLALEVQSIKQQGLNQKQLKSLKSSFITKQQQCSICCTKMRKLHRNVKLNCNHLFHRSCIEPWLSKNPNCPMCRRHVLKK